MTLESKLEKLNAILSGSDKCAVAFSGGVDSTFLLAAAVRCLGPEKVTAITIIPPYVARWEIAEAAELAEKLGVSHINLESSIIEEVKHNPADRCYHCKRALFSSMKEQVASLGIQFLCDGSNADDLGDYRPGMRALKELDITSPLLEAEMTKQDIRDLSKRWDLPTWDKPPYACLLTRIPHDTVIGFEVLKQIEMSEVVMMEEGYPYVRVRHHGEIARIEIPRTDFESFIAGGHYENVTARLKQLGYNFVTLDLSGYKMGNMNRIGDTLSE